MSKSVKDMIKRDYRTKFSGEGGPSEALVISIRGVKGTDTTRLRAGLARKNIRITVVRNSLARDVMAGSPLEALADMLEGSSALAYGGESVVEVAREIVANLPKTPGLTLKGAILDGVLFKGKAGVEELAKFPTKDEAIAQVITLVVSPARKLVGAIKGPGSKVAGIVKAIEEKLEKGEAIAKV